MRGSQNDRKGKNAEQMLHDANDAKELSDDRARAKDLCYDYNQLRPEDHSQHPSRRVGKPEDIARMCLFLCEENNDFINGENITIDGGMTKKMIYVE